MNLTSLQLNRWSKVVESIEIFLQNAISFVKTVIVEEFNMSLPKELFFSIHRLTEVAT